MKKISLLFVYLFFFLILAKTSYAHVTVKPSQVGVASFQTFSVSVPVEKEIATTQVRLIIPKDLKHVTPNVKSGWNIERKMDDKNEVITELVWQGYIPAGYREEFNFSAQVPAKEGQIAWKAYQTYEDGSIVEWAFDPKTKEGEETPYSITNIINDLEPSKKITENSEVVPKVSNNLVFFLSIVAIALAGTSFINSRRK